MLPDLAVFLSALLIAWISTRLLIPKLRTRGIVDVPNHRSSHSVPTPRGGGLGIVAGVAGGILVAIMIGASLPQAPFILACLIVGFTGYLDDRRGGSSIIVRLLLQFVAAGIVVLRSGGMQTLPLPEPLNLELGAAAVPVAMIWLVGTLNLYNFLDGIDGFAGMQGMVAGIGIAFFARGGPVAVTGLALAGACAGFLFHNWHPARVFMGDVGSSALGFAFAALPFQLNVERRIDAFFVVGMCLWFFLADGVFTLLRRLSHGEKIWQAHRSHLYQRLVQTGLPHDLVTLNVIGVSAGLGALAVISTRSGGVEPRWNVLLLGGLCFLTYYAWTLARERSLGISPYYSYRKHAK